MQTLPDTSLNNRQSAERRARRIDAAPGAMVAFGRHADIGECPVTLPAACRGEGWQRFACRFENGSEDHIAIYLSGGSFDTHVESVLSAIWPVLREDCLSEVGHPKTEAAAGALTWMAAKKFDAAVIVLDAEGTILQTNESGRDLLDMRVVLTEDSGMLCCADPSETKALRRGLKECLTGGKGDKPGADLIMCLSHKGRRSRVPVALSRYDDPGHSEPLIAALIPRQPDRKRIEMLAQKMGLTPVEARVAALMQLGLANREAAHIAGIKEQTFNTYAKRVLSKLDVGCRAEMVNMLTWQGSLGRAS
ncbi:helix-turn-helix transcriptional regulator [Roseovarius sp. S4756]|uniref:helix-turn-helix transcriptional regulator n=1 Tax=Roseovarius maritimus TaxID=3342637 RepID=UPI00372AB3C0